MTKFADSLVSSINALYLALLSFFVVYVYVCLNNFEHIRALEKLVALDKLLVLRTIATSDETDYEEPKLYQLPSFFRRAEAAAYTPSSDDDEIYTFESLAKKGFTDDNIEVDPIRGTT